MGLDDHICLKIVTHLPLKDYAALAATCRYDGLLTMQVLSTILSQAGDAHRIMLTS